MISQLQPLTAKKCEFWLFDMKAKKGQSSASKCCALLSKTAKGTDELLKEAYKDSTIKFTTVRKRHKHFTEVCEPTCDEAIMRRSRDAKQIEH